MTTSFTKAFRKNQVKKVFLATKKVENETKNSDNDYSYQQSKSKIKLILLSSPNQ